MPAATKKRAYFFAKILLLITCLLTGALVHAQDYDAVSKRIDSLDKLQLPKSALVETQKLEQLARQQKNTAQVIKATLYRIRFQTAVGENAIPAIITALQHDIQQAAYPEKPVLQSLLGDMYWNYYQQNRYSISQRSHLEKPGTDFTLWDIGTLINEIDRQFSLSLKDAVQEQHTSINILNGVLQGDTASRYLRPTLYDLLVQRALDFYLMDENSLTKPKTPFTLTDARLFADSRTFAGLKINTTDTASLLYKGMLYLQQATLFHLQKNEAAPLADLDMKRLTFLYAHASADHKEQLYLNSLTQIMGNQTLGDLRADAMVLTGKYFMDMDSLAKAAEFFNKAIALYPNSLGAKNAAGYLQNVQQKLLSIQVENIGVPGKPILGFINYRNVKTAQLKLYKVTVAQYYQLTALSNNNDDIGLYIHPSNAVLDFLKKQHPVQQSLLSLPDLHDYKGHMTEFMINPLQTGTYILAISDTAGDGKSYLQLANFKISNLGFITRVEPDGRIGLVVTNRSNGKPMPGVQVNTDIPSENRQTDINGMCVLKLHSNNYQITLITAGDTLFTEPRYTYGATTKTNEKAAPHTLFFTDREIYRPGQTIYFKGLSLQTIDGKSAVLAGQNVTVTVKQNNNKIITSIPFTTNAYGSFSGTFIIPQHTAAGGLSFLINNRDSKYLRVEEYKRPGYQVTFLPVKQTYKPNDQIVLKGNVMAYSGYGISQARVILRVSRQVMFNDYRLNQKYRALQNSNSLSVLTDTIKTDNTGRFELKFKAGADDRYNPADIYYNFNISADVTDGTGESRAANTRVAVAENNLTLITKFPPSISPWDTVKHKIWLGNFNGVAQTGQISLSVYALNQPVVPFKSRLWWSRPDSYLMDSLTFKKNFPEYAYKNEDKPEKWPVKNKVTGLSAATDSVQPLIFDADLLKDQPSGTYKILIAGKDSQGDTASVVKYLKWINPVSQKNDFSENLLLKYPLTPGMSSSYEFLVGTGKEGYMLVEKYNGDTCKTRQWVNFHEGERASVKIPVAANEQQVAVQFLTISQNRLYTRYFAPGPSVNNKLNIKFLTFRNLLLPGEKEQWKLQITGKNNEARQAEMVADLYDASLDAIAGENTWTTNQPGSNSAPYFMWYDNSDTFVKQTIGVSLNTYPRSFPGIARPYEKLNMFNYNIRNGLIIDKRDQTTSTLTINAKDVESLQPLTIDQALQGRLIGMSLNEVFVNGVMNIDNYGDNGYIAGTPAAPALNITPRSNFNETAFFYPMLHTDEQGQILIDFTMPESLTKWHFKAFAHTVDMETGYIDQEVFTQKKLSISANMPRFLRAGDTITISARLANLATIPISGKVQLQLFNALNMQPVSLLVNKVSAQQSFSLRAGSNQPVSFKLAVPQGLDALTYRLAAEGGQFSDGEENTLPVLSSQVLVTESMPMMVRPGQTKTFSFNKLINQQSATRINKTLTLEYTQNPAWYAIQAMPYLMEFPDECSEQLFNRYYANSMAANLLNSNPQIKQVFELWKNSNSAELLSALERNQALKTTLIEETPWLQDARDESERKKRIALLFDLNNMGNELEFNLDKLQKKQLTNGGFPWFAGTEADPYISTYILAGIGQLYQRNITSAANAPLKTITNRLLQYTRGILTSFAAGKTDVLSPMEIYTYYALSYFNNTTNNSVPDTLLSKYLNRAANQWQGKSIYEQGLVALTMLRDKKPEVARMIIRSLKETARRSNDMGMYWTKNQPGYYWYQSPVETQSLMIELFSEAGNNQPDIDEMRMWLLRNKQTSNWKTTKATAAACYALLLNNTGAITGSGTAAIKLGGKPLAMLKPNVKADAGTGYLQTTWTGKQIKPNLGKAQIKNNTASIGWGALHWQYLENIDKITPSKTDIQLERKYFTEKQGQTGTILTAVDATHLPRTGDILKVVMYLKAGRDLEYVQIKDLRPSGTEPVDVLSAYRYQGGLYYYQVTRDAATNFFIGQLSKGSYVFEYQLRVTQPGSFSTGISTVQSVYAPEFNAHSAGERISFLAL